MHNGLNLIYARLYHNAEYGELDDSMDFCALTLILSGCMNYCVDGRKRILKAGEAAFVKPGEHRLRYREENPASYISFNFSCAENEIPNMETFFSFSLSNEFVILAERLQQVFYSNEKNRIELSNAILDVILYECENMCRSNVGNTYVKKIKQYVSEHYKEKIKISDIAESIGISESYTSGLFRQETGDSIGKYIDTVKFNAAIDLIRNTNSDFTYISQILGFSSGFYFSRWFVKQAGLCPSLYRKNLIELSV